MSGARKRAPASPPARRSREGGDAADPFALVKALDGRMKAARKAGLIALLDVGTSKVACQLARLEASGPEAGPRLRIVGAAVQRSRGVRHGAIADIEEARAAVRAVVSEAERMGGERAFHVLASLSGGYPRSTAVSAETPLSGGAVGDRDIARALAACRMPRENDERALLHALPVNWTLDGEASPKPPLGLSGRLLGVDVHAVTIAESAARNLAHCLSRADLQLAGLAATPYASGLAALSEEEREDGAACIDIGAGLLSIALFLKGRLIYLDIVRMGGDAVTRDVSRALGLTHAEAERAKILEGSAEPMASALGQPLEPPLGGMGWAGSAPTRADLAQAMRPRLEEMLALARDALAKAGFFYVPGRRVVLTGGGAQLTGLAGAAKSVFGAPVRVAGPQRLAGAPAEVSGPGFSALAGLALTLGAEGPAEGAALWKAARETEATPKTPLGGLFRWFRDSW